METIGNRVKALRLKNGITQEELADACGVSRQTIINLEQGKLGFIKSTTLTKLASALHVSVSYFFFTETGKQA